MRGIARLFVFGTAAAIVTAHAAAAPVSAPLAPPSCYEISQPQKGDMPFGPILLNRCTGLTWVLVKASMTDVHGKDTGNFVYRWSPLLLNTGEAQLYVPSPHFPPIIQSHPPAK